MPKTLLIVESPKKSKTISKLLSRNYIVAASYGHVKDLTSSKKYPLGVDLQTFEPKYNILDNKMSVVQSLIGSATECDQILVASDKDKEGECIAVHLYQILESSGKEIKRITFDEITEKAIKKALKSPRDLDASLFEAQQTRRVLDRLIGYCVSPYLQYKQQNLSAGRVQSVALRMIVEREEEIEAFVPKKYWAATLLLEKEGEKFEASLTSSSEIKKIDINKIKVKEITSQVKDKPVKPPFTTYSLINEAHAKLGFSGAKTMQLAQSLYEDGFISYMRTDSVRSSPDAIESARKYLEENKLPLPNSPNTFTNKNNAQDAHEAIRPTSIDASPSEVFLSGETKELYSLIYNKFIASQSIPIKINATSVEFQHENWIFKSRGKIILDKGWSNIYPDADKENTLPALSKDEEIKVLSCKIQEKETIPPPRFNERTLIEQLENKSIGRPSTYATIIPKLIEKKYLSIKKDSFIPSNSAREIVNQLKQYFSFMQYDYTAQLELKLDEVAEGKSSYFETISQFWNSFSKELNIAYAKTNNISDLKCPKCNSLTEKFLSGEAYYIHCVSYPDCDFKLKSRDGTVENAFTDKSDLPCRKCGFFTKLIPSSKWGDFRVCVRGIRCCR